MKDRSLFATCAEADFFARSAEIEGLVGRALGAGVGAPSVLLKGRRWVGKTEILRRVHRRLFFDQAAVVPVYYRFRPALSPADFALNFLKETLTQVLAFNRRDSSLVKTGLRLAKLEAMLADDPAMAGAALLLKRHRELGELGELAGSIDSGTGRDLVRNALRAGTVAAAEGLPLFFIFDDVDAVLCSFVAPSTTDTFFADEFKEAISEFDLPVLASSMLSTPADTLWGAAPVETIELSGLGVEDSVDMLSDLCARHSIEYDSDVLVQVARKVEGNPLYIRSLVWAAKRSGKNFATLRSYADLYATEIMEGSIGALLKGALRLEDRTSLRLLNLSVSIADSEAGPRSFDAEGAASEFSLPVDAVRRSATGLFASGALDSALGTYFWAGDSVMADFIRQTYAVALGGSSPEEVRASFIGTELVGRYAEMGTSPEGGFTDGVKRLLGSFKGGTAPGVLFDNVTFALRYNVDSADISGNEDDSRVIIPEVVGLFDTSGWESREAGPPVLVARGFQSGRFDAGNEVVWLVFVKESTGPVNQGDVDNFLRRSAILRHRFKGVRIVRWMVAHDEFTPEAAARLEADGVYSSDALQLGILDETMAERPSESGPVTGPVSDGEPGSAERAGAGAPGAIKEFEIVLPKSSKAELVAVKAAEEIGSEMGFDADAIGQIKAALVEACINAFEHSRSRSGRVHMRFVARADRLIIYIQNRGVGFDGKRDSLAPATGPQGMPRKRGWGIELMKGFMDEVRFERLHDGTKIVLVKYLKTETTPE
ncbi:MAG: ATP-binding protein [Proteobacteria bacterium]|nr:ATP-binding protein [Pseudomonadota bacterium]